MPKLSVIMGVYNCKNIELLKKSVQSVIDQSFTDWEFLICNDGSSDNTLSVLNDIALMDSRIKILSYCENKGLAHALNVCLSEATGEFIARQDDDDESYPNRFKKQIDFLMQNKNYSFVGSNADVYDSNGIWGEYKNNEIPDSNSFLWTNPFAHPTVMFRKSDLSSVSGYREIKATRRCEDYDLFMRLYADHYIGYNIQENLYKYRIERDSHKKYRPMKYRIDEAKIRYSGFKKLKLMPKGYIYVFKPIIIGLIPQFIFNSIREKQY